MLSRHAWLGLASAATLSACYGYRPDLQLGPAQPMPVEEARQVLRQALESDTWCLAGADWRQGCGATTDVKIGSRAATFKRTEGADTMQVRLRFDRTEEDFLCYDRVYGCGADANATVVGAVAGKDAKRWPLRAPDEPAMRRVLHAYNALVAHAQAHGEAEFRKQAAAWRTHPQLSEGSERHKILAEQAFREKDVPRAMSHYEAALDTDPAWPDGNFNLALLSAELGAYGDAARYMKRYLEVVPDAKDAKSARQRIVVWEDKASRDAP